MKVLQRELRASKHAADAAGSYKNMKTQWRAFFLFCGYFSLTPVPASLECVCLFAQFLARSFKSVDSIRGYLNGVRLLHMFLGVDYQHGASFCLRLTLRGLQNKFRHVPRRAAAITPEIVISIHSLLDFTLPLDCTMWCLFLFAFLLMARSSNLVPKSVTAFDPSKLLLRRDIFRSSSCLLVLFKWSKTNQSGKRVVQVPLLPIDGSPLCPIKAFDLMCATVPAKKRAPAFCVPKGKLLVPISYIQFQNQLKELISKVNLNPASFSSHSFRRGGATWAFKAQVPSDLIQIHGDWASDAYKVYLECDIQQRAKVALRMGQCIQVGSRLHV